MNQTDPVQLFVTQKPQLPQQHLNTGVEPTNVLAASSPLSLGHKQTAQKPHTSNSYPSAGPKLQRELTPYNGRGRAHQSPLP